MLAHDCAVALLCNWRCFNPLHAVAVNFTKMQYHLQHGGLQQHTRKLQREGCMAFNLS